MVRDNASATANLVAYAATAGVKTFVYLSSLSIYGAIAGPKVDETTPIINPDTYGMTKFLGELMLQETSTLRSLSIRLPGILGPNPVRNWLTSVIERGRAGQEISIYNPDAPFNNAIHVDDLCTFVADVIERADWSRHDAVTVGADGYSSVREAVDILLRALNSSSQVSIGDDKQTSFVISSDRARLKYGYTPASVEAILRRAGRENRRPAEVLGG
jgi:nucleoside-diphosphate-sugar epimerase